MSLDEFLSRLPIVGLIVRRLYSYFRNHVAITDLMHAAIGFGLALILTRTWVALGAVSLGVGILYHIYAFIKGQP